MGIDVRRPRVWIPAALGLVLVLLVIYRIIQASAPAEATPTVEQIRAEQGVPVTVAAVEAGVLEVWREFNGTVSGAQEGIVRARTGDQVVRVPAQVGQRVGRGQLLVEQAGEGTAARARQAEAARSQASRTVERLRPLHEAGAISDQEWEQALTQLELATADLVAARDMLALTSPLAGTVTEVLARPGMIPSPGDPLVRVADLSQLVVYLRVSASEAAGIRQGQRSRAGNGTLGEVRRIALQADPETRLVEIEVQFPPTAGLIPGTLATVQVEIASVEDAVTLPRAAVREGAVWVVGEEGVVSRRPVQVGVQTRDRVEVVSGVEPGERVVVEGGALLSEGARVRVVSGAEG
ncbi:MAG TPA: efflux RND transporter periplasmic adaptor subunit [Longimicrobiales bacterium]|nr:efflux RND transporter periplasmic adaptor subunit [Longimicrobiales bacterium]